MKSILLIGGTGVISSAVVQVAIKKGLLVTTVTRGKRKLPQGISNIICDKEDKEKLSQLLDSHYDAVIDFLCYTEAELENSFKFYSNYTGQYFFISSCAVYDTRVRGIIKEDHPKQLPIWKYSIDKWAAEQKLMSLASATSCKYTIIRPAITYDNTRIPYGITPEYGYHWTLCARILSGKPIIMWNNGENHRNMMRVEDFAIGMVGLIGNKDAYNEAFNICGDEVSSWRDVLSIVEKYLHKKAIIINMPSEFYAEQIPYRAGELLGGRSIDSKNSNEKIKAVVPEFKQSISIEEGIYKTLDAYKENNFENGIDWRFDAETDRAIEIWCKHEGVSTKEMNLEFVDYLGSATLEDRIHYSKIRYENSKYKLFLWRLVNKLYKFYLMANRF